VQNTTSIVDWSEWKHLSNSKMPNVKRPNMCESSYRNEVQMWYEKSQISICWMMRHHFFILAALILKKLQSLASKPKWPKVFVIVQIGTPLYLNVAQTICVISWGCVKGAWYEGKKNICLKMFFWQECQKCLDLSKCWACHKESVWNTRSVQECWLEQS